jgi:hypothetical protein
MNYKKETIVHVGIWCWYLVLVQARDDCGRWLLTSNDLGGDFVADHSRNKHMDKKINLESTSKNDKIKLIK